MNAHLRSGRYHDADDVIERALDALHEKASVPKSAERRQAVVNNNIKTIVFWLAFICMAVLLWAFVR